MPISNWHLANYFTTRIKLIIVTSDFLDGCSPPSPPVNGKISHHSSGAVGAMLTFQCDTGYMPQGATSTCMPNTSWIPIPMCNGTIAIAIIIVIASCKQEIASQL